MMLQRSLAVAALVLMLLSTTGGLIHGLSTEHQTLLRLREHHQPAFAHAAQGRMDAARLELQQAIQHNFRYVRVIDAHTHVIKLASLALMLSFIVPLLPLSDRGRRVLAAAFLAGAVLFPGGVLGQVWVPGMLFQGVAALGAGLVIAAMGTTVHGLFTLPRE
jgi:hypothetical protein